MDVETLVIPTQPEEPQQESEQTSVVPKPDDDEGFILTKYEMFVLQYASLKKNNPFCKIGFHALSFATFIVVGFDSPQQVVMYEGLPISCTVIFLLNFFFLTFDLIFRTKANQLNKETQIFGTWDGIQLVMSFTLLASAAFQIVEILGFTVSPYIIQSITRVPLALILLLLVREYVNIDFGEVFNNDALLQLAKVLFFSVYFYTIFTLLGIQLFGGVNGVCVLPNTSSDNIGDMSFTIPLLHCNLIFPTDGYVCPDGYMCADQRSFSVSDGNLYFSDPFQGLMFIYQGSILDGWSTQFINSIQGGGLISATIYYCCLVLLSAWLVRNVFVAVITQVLSSALAYDPPAPVYDLENANFGLSFYADDESIKLIDNAGQKSEQSLFKKILLIILNSIFYNMITSVILIADIAILAFVGMIYPWQAVLAAIFFLQPLLRIATFGIYYLTPAEWIVYEFLMPTINVIAVILNYLGYHHLDIIYAIRTIKIISVHDFIFKYIERILGSYSRFSIALVLAICFLIVLSNMSLQIFCGIPTISEDGSGVLNDFPTSFITIFIIFLQGGAFDITLSLSALVSYQLYYFVVLYMVGINFFSNTLMMSVFITFILENLELSEEEIQSMQKNIEVNFEPLDNFAGGFVESRVVNYADTITDDLALPYRFKVYNYFKDSPLSVSLPAELVRLKFPSVSRTFFNYYFSQSFITTINHLPELAVTLPDDNNQREKLLYEYFGTKFDENIPKSKMENQNTPMLLLNLIKEKLLSSKKPGAKDTSSADQSGGDSLIDKDILILQQKINELIKTRRRLISNAREQHPSIDDSLFFFGSDNSVRKLFGDILNSRYKSTIKSPEILKLLSTQTYFEWVMVLITAISSVFMMLETSYNMVFDKYYTLVIEYIYTATTIIEIVLRVISQGLILTPSAMFIDGSQILNFILAFFGLIHLFYFMDVSPNNKFIYRSSYSSFAIFLRVIRCFRPLRVLLILKPLFNIIVLLIGGWKPIAKVLALLLILILFCAYFGYLSFNGLLPHCNDEQITDINECVGTFIATLSATSISTTNPNYNTSTFTILTQRKIVAHSRFNFDSFGWSYLAAYILMTLDGWVDCLDYVSSIVGNWVTLYFYAYVFFANLIGVSMFVGVVVQSYNINTGVALLTKDQRHWSDLASRIELTSPEFTPARPINSFLSLIYTLIMSIPYKIFHTIIMCVSPIILLIGSLNDASIQANKIIYIYIILGCHAFFLFDIILKILSFSPFIFIKGQVNKMDTILVLAILICAGLEIDPTYKENVILNYMLIVCIIIEFLLLSTRWEALYDLMQTFLMSVNKSLTAICVMLIIMLVYALIGNVLFGTVKYGSVINNYFNFRTPFNGLYILLILATGDNWSAFLLDLGLEQPFCTYNENLPVTSDCGGLVASIIYCISYIVINQQMLLNLFIATVLSNFAVFCASDEVQGRFKPSDIKTYIALWNNFDQEQNSQISLNYARMLLLDYFNTREYNSPEDIFILYKLYEELDRKVKEEYLIDKQNVEDDFRYRTEGKVAFRQLMVLLATWLTDIRLSFKTNEFLDRIPIEDEISDEVAAMIIVKWYRFIKTLKVNKSTREAPLSSIRLPTETLNLEGKETQNLHGPNEEQMLFNKEINEILSTTIYTDPDELDYLVQLRNERYNEAFDEFTEDQTSNQQQT